MPLNSVNGSNNRFAQSFFTFFSGVGLCYDVTYSCFTENYYLLKTGSLAINGGFNDANQPTDCGIFGGEPNWVYKVGCIPSVPSIYKLTAPSTKADSNPYNITVSVRSNN